MEKRRLASDFEEDKSIQMDESSLIQQTRILTPTEFLNLIPNGNYEDYRIKFYSNSIQDFYERYHRETWFSERYLKETKFHYTNEDLKNEQNEWYFIPSVRGSVNDIFEEFKSSAEKICLVQNGFDFKFSRDVYLLTNRSEGSKIIKSEIYDKPFKYSEKQLKDVYNSLSKLFKLEISKDISSLNASQMKDILRFDFLFCTTCQVKYDSEIQMRHICSSAHLDAHYSSRRMELLASMYNGDYSFLNTLSEMNHWTKEKILHTSDGVRCLECHKLFENEACALKHLSSMHPETSEYLEAIVQMVKNLDIYLIHWIEGTVTCDKFKSKDFSHTPFFAKIKKKFYTIKYKIPLVYSGNKL